MNTQQMLLSCAMMALTALGGQAVADPTEGEASPILACFYDCKLGPGVRTDTWQEVTTLKMTNQYELSTYANLTFLNAQGGSLAKSQTLLSPTDLDEINVCMTLKNAGISPPSTGLVEIKFSASANVDIARDGSYVWMKNWFGKFFTNQPEPSMGLVTSVAKTECRVVPKTLNTVIPETTVIATPVYVDGTAE